MKKTHKVSSAATKVTVLATALWSVGVIWVCAACSQQQQVQGQERQRKLTDYPSRFFVSSEIAKLVPEYGLQTIGRAEGLTGSLCWVGSKESPFLPLNPSTVGSPIVAHPVLQLVDVNDGTISQIKSFELPPYDKKIFGSPTLPHFWGSKERLLVHVPRSTAEYASHLIYNIDLTKKQGVRKEDQIFFPNEFRVSPHGDAYAFGTAPPQTGWPYNVIAVTAAKREEVANDRVSSDFSWSGSGNLIGSGSLRGEELSCIS
jgi:hypothetical protein